MDIGILERMYDFLDPVIISLKTQLPPAVLKAEAERVSARPALDRLSSEELLGALRIQQQIRARYDERQADIVREMIARGLPIPEQFKPQDV